MTQKSPICLTVSDVSRGDESPSLESKLSSLGIYSRRVLIIVLNVFRSRLRLPKVIFRSLIFVYTNYKSLRSEPIQLDLQMFERGQFGLKNSVTPISRNLASVQLLYISTKKDFKTLPTSIMYSRDSLRNFAVEEISVFVPENQVSECKEILQSDVFEVDVKSENQLVTPEQWRLLHARFNDRAGWVLQQILKVAGTLHSSSSYTLIVDSDTIVLRERNWIPAGKSGVLTPSDEFTPDYYRFLHRLGIGSGQPLHSFVSHHMLIEKKFLIQALARIGVASVSDLVDICIAQADKESFSPLCVDYELYAQFMEENYPEKIHLEKWANLGMPAKYFDVFNSRKILARVLSNFYDSISFHSWS